MGRAAECLEQPRDFDNRSIRLARIGSLGDDRHPADTFAEVGVAAEIQSRVARLDFG